MKRKQKIRKTPGLKQVHQITWIEQFKWQAIALILICFVYYGNTIQNGYVLDDGLVISENPYTKKGVRGISDLLTKDAYQWYYDQFGSDEILSGGRYRPLSIITFAIEWQFFKENPGISHFVNILIYALTIVLLLKLLRNYIFPRSPGLAFFITLLFAIHPIHTEAVANIKSRDELMSFLFLTLTLIYLFRYVKIKKPGLFLVSIFTYFLALLSKENGITYLFIIPATLFFFSGKKINNILKLTLPYLGIATLYFVIRYAVVGLGAKEIDDLMNNPFLLATASEKTGTIFYILLKYLSLLFYPYPLSYDYGYNAIPYRDLLNLMVVFSILIHIGLLVYAVIMTKRKSPMAYAIWFYIATISIISNLVVNIGATMGERLIYHSSFGFVMATGLALHFLWQKVKPAKQKETLIAIMAILTIITGVYVINRNAVWKDNNTLFVHDVKVVPNSIKAQNAAGNSYINLYLKDNNPENLRTALQHLLQTVELYPVGPDVFKRNLYMYNIYLNIGYCYYTLDDLENAELYWTTAQKIKPAHEKILEYMRLLSNKYLLMANETGLSNVPLAIEYYKKSIQFNPENADAWYNLGGAYYTKGNFIEAKKAFEKTLAIDPQHPQARQGLDAINQILNQ
jgi:protein O-mannosyl-transferase